MALVMRQKDDSQNKQHQYILFYCVVEGLVLYFCMSLIQVANKIVSPMAHTTCFPTALTLYTQMKRFYIQKKNTKPNGWLWSWNTWIFLQQTTSTYDVFHWKVKGWVLHSCLPPIRRQTKQLSHNIVFLQHWAYNPRYSFSKYRQKEAYPTGWLWSCDEGVIPTTNNIKICCFHWGVAGLVLLFCLFPIQLANKIAFRMDQEIILSTTSNYKQR